LSKAWSRVKPAAAYAGVMCVALIAASSLHQLTDWQIQGAWKKYQQTKTSELQSKASDVSKRLDALYHGLRTISLLPSIRNIQKDNVLVAQDSIKATEQIYNTLNSEIGLSEIYIVAAPFNHGRFNLKTGRLESPQLVFDQLTSENSKAKKSINLFAELQSDQFKPIAESLTQVEDEEYSQLEEQVGVYQSKFGTLDKIHGVDIPILNSPEIITCDNHVFATTHSDPDRRGLLFSVPFYNEAGIFKGVVSATILNSSIASLINSPGFSLVDPSLKYFMGEKSNSAVPLTDFQPTLFQSRNQESFLTTSSIATTNPFGAWSLNYDLKVADFYKSGDFRSIRSFAFWSYCSLLAATLFGLGTVLSIAQRTARLRKAATHDALTDLPNRVLFEEKLQDHIDNHKPGTGHAVFFLDLDKFKTVNDTLGHHVGDLVLVKAAQRLSKCLRKGDVLARIGGDEFVVLLSGLDGADAAINLAVRMTRSISKAMDIEGHEISIGTSIGIDFVRNKEVSPSEVLRHADLALFRAKAEERGSFRFYEPAMDAAREERRMLEGDLRQALARKEFVLHYQSIVNAKTSKVVGCEALLRWMHPKLGLVPPMSFIPLAEETGLINAIGEWVLKQACLDAVSLPSHVRMAVNLSPIQFRNPSLALQVVTALNNAGLAPNRLELEVTESLLLNQDDNVKNILKQLNTLGVRIALDDFGVGYSSLGYLKDFSFDKIKIDRAFMKDIENAKDSAILRAITDLSNSLGVTTVAEGVETASQLQKVREQGCTEVQGFYFSKPVPIATLLENQPVRKIRA
jgi:diguanylate cyclase (GGDEF)-like protein